MEEHRAEPMKAPRHMLAIAIGLSACIGSNKSGGSTKADASVTSDAGIVVSPSSPRDAAVVTMTPLDGPTSETNIDASIALHDSGALPPLTDAGHADDDADVMSEPILGQNPTVGVTDVVAPLAGTMYTPPSDQTNIGFHGTDLGFPVAYQGQLQVLFGDSWSSTIGTTIDPNNDDVQGAISLADFPNADAVDAFVRAHPASSGTPPWQAAGPTIRFPTNSGKIAPIIPYRAGMALSMPLGRTPVAAWSDGRQGLYALFLRQSALPCSPGSNGAPASCPDGYVCDEGLGTFLAGQGDGALVCVVDQDSGCVAGSNPGYCQDPTSSVYDTTLAGRRLSVVYQHELGSADPTQLSRYNTHTWLTNKFINPAARTVADFDPSRKDGSGNVYTLATGSGPREKAMLWGRPWFVGVGSRHHDARLYFSYFDMPTFSASGQFTPSAHYFTGVVDGVPQFSPAQIDAKPLDLSTAGADPSSEPWDIVGQHCVAYIDALKKWLLFYGGDLTELPLSVMQGPETSAVQHDPEAAIHVRFADQPWGPWSPPQQVLRGTMTTGSASALPSAPQGILRRPDCTASSCAPHESFYGADEMGFFYAPNVIDEWTRATDDGVDIYWSVSTWDPYQVVLMKTHFIR
ncbi:MAG TPA: hypothetical protein VHZ95_19945 [Polyangiales bacterium]|nr:hypothetical protein [Polyangiales bacterium]